MRKLAPYITLYGVYFLAAVAITYPLITQIDTRLIGHPFGDAYEYVGLSWWIRTALQTGRDPFFQPLLLYPDGLPAPLLWSIPLQSFPTWLLAFFLPLTAAFNLSALLTLALNGTAMFELVRYLLRPHPPAPSPWGEGGQRTDAIYGVPTADGLARYVVRPHPPTPSPWGEGGQSHAGRETDAKNGVPTAGGLAACLSGLIWMAYPTFQGQLGAAHTGLLTLWGAPLLMLALLKLRDTNQPRRWIVLAAVLFPVSLWGNLTLIVYLIAPLCVMIGAWAVWHDLTPQPPLRGERGSERTPYMASLQRGWFIRVVTALAIGAGLGLIFALPTLLDTSGGSPLQADGDVRYSAPLVGIAAPSFYHPLFSGFEHSRRALGVEPFENASYIGVVAAGLCLIGIICHRAARGWLALAAVAWIFSLGALLKIDAAPMTGSFDGIVTPISLPWAIFQDLPGLGFARTPARFNFAVGFAVAVMAGYGVATVFKFRRRPTDSKNAVPTPNKVYRNGWRVGIRFLSTFVLAALILFEYQFWFPLPTIPGVVPDGIRTLSERGDIRAVFDIPFEHPLVSKEAMFLQTGHGLPILTGQITRETPIDPAKAALLQNTLDPALLNAAGADAIIVHRQWENRDSPFALDGCCGDPVYEDDDYAVYLVPPYDGEPPAFISLAPENATATVPISVYFYAPTPGGALLTASLTADGRDVTATLDDAPDPLTRWTINGSADAALWVEFDAGYHTLTLALDPPCAVPPLPSLTCAPLTVEGLSLE